MPSPFLTERKMTERHLYTYSAVVTSVYDGDTCTVDIDLGLGVWVRGEKIRLARINAPELRKEERPRGILSRDRLRELIRGRQIILQTIRDKKGKYGRYLGEIWLVDEDGPVNVNDLLVSEGFAEYKDY